MTAAEFALARSFFNMIAAFLMLKQQKIGLTEGIEKSHMPALYLRCGVGTICFILVMYILKILPLTIFFMIFQTAPFLTAIIAWVWLGESISSFEIFAMIGSYIGIALIGLSKPASQDGQIEVKSNYTLGIVLSLIAAVGMAIIATSTRKLKTLHYGVI